jgi:kinesin family protein 13
MQKQDKTESDVEREQSLVNQWVSLTEERNTVLIPVSSSGIPGKILIHRKTREHTIFTYL